MKEDTKELVIVMTRGIDSELSSVAFTLANGAITAGMQVRVCLTSAAVDVVRRKGHDMTHVPPLDPLAPAAPSATLYTLVASPMPASDVTVRRVATSFTHTACAGLTTSVVVVITVLPSPVG